MNKIVNWILYTFGIEQKISQLERDNEYLVNQLQLTRQVAREVVHDLAIAEQHSVITDTQADEYIEERIAKLRKRMFK